MRKNLAVFLTLLSTLFISTPAQAHDLLIDIYPAADSVVSESPFQATLTFNNPLLVVEGEVNAEIATQLVGTDEWINHEVAIDDRTMQGTINLSEPGDYLLRWKVVSSDGHPISGESTFTLDIEPSSDSEAADQPLVIAPNPNGETEADSGSLTGFYIGLAMVALGAIFAPIGLLMRRRAKKS